MTIILPLQPQEEARLLAVARAKGLPPEAIVRAALEKLLADTDRMSDTPATGAALVAAMQSSPYQGVDLERRRDRLPVRDASF
jgi:hypothetical protein